MLYAQTPPHEKRRLFRERLASGELLRFPGAFNPLSARLIARKGFEGVYISGAVLSADLGLPDIGLTTLTEVAARGAQTRCEGVGDRDGTDFCGGEIAHDELPPEVLRTASW